jgi:hypothetical protein
METPTDTGSDHDAGGGEAAAFDPVTFASELGWKPKEEWKGDTSKWTDAPDFLRRRLTKAEEAARDYKKSIERVTRTASRLVESERAEARRAIAAAEQRIEEAAAEGDADAARAATADLKRAQAAERDAGAPNEFALRNPWFETDDEARELAVASAQVVANRGGTKEQQFEAAEKAVRKAFPKLFEGADDDDDPPPKPKPKAPHTEGGNRTPSTRTGPKGWNDMPAEARKQMKKAFVDKGMLTEVQAAKAYWEENS